MKALMKALSVAAMLIVATALARGETALAQTAQQWKVGDRVAMPAGYSDKWLQAVIVRVDPSSPFPYRVHPLGYLDTMDTSFNAAMLRAPGSVKTEPIGGIANDPWLMKVTGMKAFHPTTLYPGKYECWTLSQGGSSYTQSAMILNFEILDNSHYRDVSGAVASYRFDLQTATLVFQGGALNGQQAGYEQVSNPPTASQPPTVTLKVSGDQCQRPIR